MNKLSIKALMVLAAIIMLGIAGKCDYEEEVLYNMPNETYRYMKEKLNNPSDSEIVEEYQKNPEYWDKVLFDCTYK